MAKAHDWNISASYEPSSHVIIGVCTVCGEVRQQSLKLNKPFPVGGECSGKPLGESEGRQARLDARTMTKIRSCKRGQGRSRG